MKKTGLAAIIFFLLSFCFNNENWVLTKNKEGIKVYLANKKGSNYKQCKTLASVKTDINSLYRFLVNPVNYKTFSDKIERVKIIKETSSKIIYYLSVDLPWPVSNRDGVYELTKLTKTNNEATFVIEAKPNYLKKQKGYIRIKKSNVYYKISTDNNSTNVYYTSHTEANGSIPSWVTNYYLEDGPINNIKAMRNALENN